ncbi:MULTISPECIES: hypothetical protein [unclassified Coleofasciculus]|uniref:hypothetical protein n=1 Tax=unclassified Coleofasciculus TaxID=2692782 RepID=UPI0018802143|nr:MULTISPECIES: hypothetical protein [unclassified Coleofasciculus]MBE9127135.1 hypothetical protein [Coleofasciculus sp. LEGE 07081]MBE9152321.1 hypothetical protein [Coleofasciculus sp. LEGE 07092]
MTQLPPDDKEWQEFLRQHCPTPPPAADDLEDRLLNAIEEQEQPMRSRGLWAIPPAIVAGLLMAWSGYRTLIPLPEPSHSSASLEAFLENNWNSVTGETPVSSSPESTPANWVLLANTAP